MFSVYVVCVWERNRRGIQLCQVINHKEVTHLPQLIYFGAQQSQTLDCIISPRVSCFSRFLFLGSPSRCYKPYRLITNPMCGNTGCRVRHSAAEMWCKKMDEIYILIPLHPIEKTTQHLCIIPSSPPLHRYIQQLHPAIRTVPYASCWTPSIIHSTIGR